MRFLPMAAVAVSLIVPSVASAACDVNETARLNAEMEAAMSAWLEKAENQSPDRRQQAAWDTERLRDNLFRSAEMADAERRASGLKPNPDTYACDLSRALTAYYRGQ